MITFMIAFIIVAIIIQRQVLSDQTHDMTSLRLRKRHTAEKYIPEMLCPNFLCVERPSAFVFQFTGTTCDTTTNGQDGKFDCDDNIGYDMMKRNGAYIRIISVKKKKSSKNKNKDENNNSDSDSVYFKKWVSTGDSFRFSNNGSKFPADMQFEVYTNSGLNILLQSMNIHTSCSKNLYVGDQFGSLKLVGLQYDNGVDIECEVLEPTMAPSKEPSVSPSFIPSSHPSMNPSNQPTTLPSATPSTDPTTSPSSKPSNYPSSNPSNQPTTPPSTTPSADPTTSPSLIPSSQPSMNPSNQPTTLPSTTPSTKPTLPPSSKPSTQPTSIPTSSPSIYPSSFPSVCPPNLCLERPKKMTFRFLGTNCQSSSNTQGEDVFVCADYEKMSPSMNPYVIFSSSKKKKKKEKKEKDDDNKKGDEDEDIYFDGNLTEGMIFDISSGDDYDSKSKLPSNMNVRIYSFKYHGIDGDEVTASSPVLLQSFTFHSSCSQNLYLGDQFGAIKLVGFEYNDGTVDKCY